MKSYYKYLKHHEKKNENIFQSKELLNKIVPTYDSAVMAGAIHSISGEQIKAGEE
jgi:hypothetical protein